MQSSRQLNAVLSQFCNQLQQTTDSDAFHLVCKLNQLINSNNFGLQQIKLLSGGILSKYVPLTQPAHMSKHVRQNYLLSQCFSEDITMYNQSNTHFEQQSTRKSIQLNKMQNKLQNGRQQQLSELFNDQSNKNPVAKFYQTPNIEQKHILNEIEIDPTTVSDEKTNKTVQKRNKNIKLLQSFQQRPSITVRKNIYSENQRRNLKLKVLTSEYDHIRERFERALLKSDKREVFCLERALRKKMVEMQREVE